MGQYNSSKTRVAPVFDHLLKSDPRGGSWLRRLIELGSRSDAVSLLTDIGELKPDHPSWWVAKERRLEDERRAGLEIIGPHGNPDDSFDVDGEDDEDESE